MLTAMMIVLNTFGAAAHSEESIVKVISTIQEVTSNCDLSGSELETERSHIIFAAKLAKKHILPHMDTVFASLVNVYKDMDAFEQSLNEVSREHNIDVVSMILESRVFIRSVSSDLNKRLADFELQIQKRGRNGEIDLEALTSSKTLRDFVNKGARFINELATLTAQVNVRHVPENDAFISAEDINKFVTASTNHFYQPA